MVSLADFKKLVLRSAKVMEVRDHPNADRLWILKIDLGGETKEIVAGIKPMYAREDLVGRSIVVVDNIEPADVRGVRSSAMLLAARSGGALALLTTDRELPPGSLVS